nr:type IV pilin protein [Psychrobacter frigidicola]
MKGACISHASRGFTLIELMIVVAVIGILATVAYPNYQRYIVKSKRTDMMSEMHNIASEIQSRKLAQGKYSNELATGLAGDYPRQGSLYTVTITPAPLTAKWKITATPKAGLQMVADGALSLDYQGIKCRATLCGSSNEWNQ